MRNIIHVVIILVCLSFIISCEKDDIVDSSSSFVNTQVDLIGFSDSYVELSFNGAEYYRAHLSSFEPFAGPQASFTTQLPRGNNEVITNWIFNSNSHNDITNITIGDSKHYYLSIVKTSGDSIIINVQDIPFYYL